jgi:hypothetical protein
MSSIIEFTAFYPSPPFWAKSDVDFSSLSTPESFYEQMTEEVYSRETPNHTIKVCRDGMIMLRIEALELGERPPDPSKYTETARRWADYLDYVNSFYLLLDSASVDVAKRSYFALQEVTSDEALRVRYDDGKRDSETFMAGSRASFVQNLRNPWAYRSRDRIGSDPTILARDVVAINVIERAADLFAKVVDSPDLAKALGSFAKSLSEYKVGNYDISIVLSWFISEAIITELWGEYVDTMNRDLPSVGKRIGADRRQFLTRRDLSVRWMSNLLELWEQIDHADFLDIDMVRGYRNSVVHPRHDRQIGAAEAQLALKTAQSLVNRRWAFDLRPNLNYSVPSLWPSPRRLQSTMRDVGKPAHVPTRIDP